MKHFLVLLWLGAETVAARPLLDFPAVSVVQSPPVFASVRQTSKEKPAADRRCSNREHRQASRFELRIAGQGNDGGRDCHPPPLKTPLDTLWLIGSNLLHRLLPGVAVKLY